MSKTGENIYKRKDGRWEGRYIIGHIGGKIKYGYVYSRTYGETKSKLHMAINTKESIYEKNLAMYYFGQFADKWLISIRPQIKESTAVRYENILRLYIDPYFCNKPISDITNEELCSFANDLLTSGGRRHNGLSVKTVSGVLSVMNNVFVFASSMNTVVKANTKSVSLKYEQKRIRVLNCFEQNKLNSYLCSNLNESNLGILLCLYTGLRIGEICALKWGDISLDNKTITVNKTMQRIKSNHENSKTKVIVTAPKSNCSVRTIPIPDCIVDMLINMKCDDDTYFLTGKTDKFVEPRTMQNRFKAVIKKCGISGANFHSLRHTFATRCVELGFDIKSLSEVLGHASVNITLARYVHPSMEFKRDNMNKLSELLAVR